MRHFLIMTALLVLPVTSFAQDTTPAPDAQSCSERMQQTLSKGEFTKKRYSIHGNWDVQKNCTDTTINFHDDFKTKGGPDLKVYLSKHSLSDLGHKNAAQESYKLGVLKANKGAQSYILPTDLDLSQYKSVIIHCEAFSVLWGGFDL